MRRSWQWLKRLAVHHVLGLDDTPHRIAWGVFLGWLVAWTPTLGFQIVLYLMLAALLRANKVSGIPFLFISNPVTAVPVYFFAWKVGHILMTGGDLPEASERQAMRERLAEADVPDEFWGRMTSLDFWEELVRTILAMGGKMWLGALVLGIVCAVPAYFLCYWGVREHRRRHMRRVAAGGRARGKNKKKSSAAPQASNER